MRVLCSTVILIDNDYCCTPHTNSRIIHYHRFKQNRSFMSTEIIRSETSQHCSLQMPTHESTAPIESIERIKASRCQLLQLSTCSKFVRRIWVLPNKSLLFLLRRIVNLISIILMRQFSWAILADYLLIYCYEDRLFVNKRIFSFVFHYYFYFDLFFHFYLKFRCAFLYWIKHFISLDSSLFVSWFLLITLVRKSSLSLITFGSLCMLLFCSLHYVG